MHGQCLDEVDDYTCICDDGYTDQNCATDIDECQSYPCVNGVCNDTVGSWVCRCDEGFAGINCDAEATVTGTTINNSVLLDTLVKLLIYVTAG